MRILLADDQTKVRFALRVLLERQPDYEVSAEALDTEGLMAQIEADCPDVLLLAWELPGQGMEELMPALHRACPKLAVVALSGRPELRATALASGADAFVCKCDPPEGLLELIEEYRDDRAQP